MCFVGDWWQRIACGGRRSLLLFFPRPGPLVGAHVDCTQTAELFFPAIRMYPEVILFQSEALNDLILIGEEGTVYWTLTWTSSPCVRCHR